MKFTLQSKNKMYLNSESSIYREEGIRYDLAIPADHELSAEFEVQMAALVREYLSVHHPGALDDAPDATALCLMGAARGAVGDILFV